MKNIEKLVRFKRRDLFFIGAWALTFLVLRFVSTFTIPLPHSLPDRFVLFFYSLFLGGAQDIGLAFVIWGVYRIVCNAFPSFQSSINALFLCLFVGIMSYCLFDAFLFQQLTIRMSSQLLFFFLTPGPFLDSAKQMGLTWLVVAETILIGISLIGYRLFHRMKNADIHFPFFPLFFFSVLLSFLVGLSFFPSDIKVVVNNVFVEEFSNLKFFKKPETAKKINLRKEFVLPTEKAEFLSDEFPLLRTTSKFEGPKKFEIDIKKEEKPHVIFLFLESFRAKDVGVLGGRRRVSPKFDELSKSGILFSQFYANGVQTTRAVLSSLFGVIPKFSVKSIQTHHHNINLIGVPQLLKKEGYQSTYFHNGSLSFTKKSRFFKRHGFEEIHGRDKMIKKFPKAPRSSWGIPDEYLMKYYVDWLEEADKKGNPAFSVLFTVSNHHPWKLPSGFTPPTKIKGKDEYSNYLRSFSYSDAMINRFMELMDEKGLAKKSLIFILSDTAQPMGDHDDNFMLIKHLYEENIKVPFLILAPGRIKQPKIISTVGSQVDLLPTLMDILSLSGSHHSMGTSLVRDIGDRSVYFNNPFSSGYLGVRLGPEKYVFDVNNERNAAYRLKDDPTEKYDLSHQRHKELSFWRQKVWSLRSSIEELVQKNRFSPLQEVARGEEREK